MGNLYVDTGGNAANSGSTDDTSPLTGASATAVASTTVTLDAGTVLTSVVISGQNQSTINLAGTSVGNRTIFWITGTAGSGGATPTVTVDVAVTCAGVSWRIGGRYLWPSGAGVNVMEGALGLGLTQDVLQFNNSPATKTVTYITARNPGDSAKGQVRLIGKAGTRPVLNVTNTTVPLTMNQVLWAVENFELQQNGGSGNAATLSGTSSTAFNVKVSDAGAIGLSFTAIGAGAVGCEVSGVLTTGISMSAATAFCLFNNCHDNTGDGFLDSSGNPALMAMFNVADTNGGRGFLLSGSVGTISTSTSFMSNNTFYGNGNSGLEITDADQRMSFYNNIFLDNGNAGTEYNVEWVAGQAEFIGFHGWNCFSIAGGAGGGNLLNTTANSTEITSSPQFVNAAGGDFRLLPGSPCRAAGFPGAMLGGSTGYLDMGAIQMRHPFAPVALHGIDNGIAA